jgi:hypothetical protein
VIIWGCRKLHSGELNDLYFSQNIIRGVHIKKVTWISHVDIYRREKNMLVRFWWENLKQRNYPEDLGIDGILILKGTQK